MGYCLRADLEKLYGAANVAKWADKDNDGDADTIAASIEAEIDFATATIDDALRGGLYEVPLTVVPATIVRLAAMLTGVGLYEARGVSDFDTVTGAPMHRLSWHRDRVERMLKAIRTGGMRMDLASHASVPVVSDVPLPAPSYEAETEA